MAFIARAKTAITANAAFLAVTTPTTASAASGPPPTLPRPATSR